MPGRFDRIVDDLKWTLEQAVQRRKEHPECRFAIALVIVQEVEESDKEGEVSIFRNRLTDHAEDGAPAKLTSLLHSEVTLMQTELTLDLLEAHGERTSQEAD